MIHSGHVEPAASTLTPAEASSVLALAAQTEAVDGVAPLSEQTLLRLQDGASAARHLLARSGDRLVGYSQWDDTGTAELVVAPDHRAKGLGRELLGALESAVPDAQRQVWAHGDLPAAAALAASAGYTRARVLLQLRRSLQTPLPDPRLPEDVQIRTFSPGVDEAAWLAVNNAAFASHPEQGRWTLHDVRQREDQPWFDPAGLFLAERNGELIGFHWTKVHTEERPPIGEVYVVGVRPQDAGHGLGPALTLIGLHHLHSLGLGQVLLYVDEDNVPAMKTYERLGFSRWATDVLYAPRPA